MFRVIALYPHTAGARFDADYYVRKHAPFAREILGPHGLKELRITIGVAALDGGTAPFSSVSELVFATREDFDAAMAACGERLFADLPNYTDISPTLQVCELSEI